MANWTEIEAKIMKAVKEAQALGVKIEPGVFGFCEPGKTCCPITAYLGPDHVGESIGAAAEKLGLSRHEVWDFVFGFDRAKDDYNIDRPGFQLGLAIREKVCP